MTARAPQQFHTETEERDHLERRLARDLGRAVAEFAMIEQGDRVMVAISGGKDSYTMLHLLRRFQRSAPIDFDIVAVNLDQGHPGFPVERLREWLAAEGYEHRIVYEDTHSVVTSKIPEGETYCSLCSRLRRGILYTLAQEMRCTKIALGHHRDDVLATLMLNLVFAGQLKAMPPKLKSDDGRNVVIRPLVYAAEDTIARFAELQRFPILPCDLCGSQENLQRKQMQRLLSELEANNPGAKQSMLAALRNVRPTHLLDAGLWRKLALPLIGDAPPEEPEAAETMPIPVDRLARN
ncbi:MAG: tRNA 2-thiocytidine(32) synthetase TtcA [Deltaproteobacteria bacterium]|nr:tRNA 2-thiocytidine(32) synthetase TtcA [Deltaproteobacteria bacterium]